MVLAYQDQTGTCPSYEHFQVTRSLGEARRCRAHRHELKRVDCVQSELSGAVAVVVDTVINRRADSIDDNRYQAPRRLEGKPSIPRVTARGRRGPAGHSRRRRHV